MTVRGEATINAPSDLATLSCTVHASGSSADQVRDRLGPVSDAVQVILTEFEADLESTHTQGLHVGPVIDPGTPSMITGYAGSYATQLVVNRFEALPRLVQALSRVPQSQLDGPWWSLRRGHPSYRQARLDAIAEAVRRANDYANALDRAVGDLVEISDLDGGHGGPPIRAFARAASFDVPSISFQPQLQSVTASVTARFALTEPDPA